MHDTVIDFVKRFAREEHIKGRLVLEVGACDVNGSVRPHLEKLDPALYVGTDARPGPRVDEVVDACDLVELFGLASFDAVICCEMLEHCFEWQRAINAMKAVLRPGGLLVMTARSWGFPKHDHPGDHWRFEVADFERIFADLRDLVIERDIWTGVFAAGFRKDDVIDVSGLTVRAMPD